MNIELRKWSVEDKEVLIKMCNFLITDVQYKPLREESHYCNDYFDMIIIGERKNSKNGVKRGTLFES